MNKQIIAGGILLASLGAASAQGLYDIAPNDDVQDSLPITWSAGASLGYDDNVTPTVVAGPGREESSGYISAYVGAAWVTVTPQTTWDIYGRIGGTWYFDAPSSMSNDGYGEGKLGINWEHRVSERLRFSSRNYLAYEMEPDYSYGLTLDRQLDPYFHYTTDNAVGYKWSERWATYTGFRFNGVTYNDNESRDVLNSASHNDRNALTLYHQFRYRSSEQTVWTLDYRYTATRSKGFASDSDSQYLLAGIEHRFNPNTVGVMKFGAQFRSPDKGDNKTQPFFEGALRSQVNEQFSVRAFARYSMEEYGTSFGGYAYDYNNAFRLGVTGSYIVSPVWTLFGGINYIRNDMNDANRFAISDLDQDQWNLNLGFSYKVNDAVYVTGSYNYTNSSANGGTDLAQESRKYSQNRASLGVRYEF
jgi:hypothetical protein